MTRPAAREWTVAGGLVMREGHVLVVRNVRRGGIEDWSTPGGVIDLADATLRAGLTREVAEETGIVVHDWAGPLYEVTADAPDMGWHMRCEVHLAVAHAGEIAVADPDGIVVEAEFCPRADVRARLGAGPAWVREPLVDWLDDPWPVAAPGTHRVYRYAVRGVLRHDSRNDLQVARLA